MARRPQALNSPGINAIYDVLKEGEKDRPKLTEPRHRPARPGDIGRIVAAKVRTEGYVVLLGRLIRPQIGRSPTRDCRARTGRRHEKNSVLENMGKKRTSISNASLKNIRAPRGLPPRNKSLPLRSAGSGSRASLAHAEDGARSRTPARTSLIRHHIVSYIMLRFVSTAALVSRPA